MHILYPGDYGHSRRKTVVAIVATAIAAILIFLESPIFPDRVRDGIEFGFLLWVGISAFAYAVLGIRFWHLPEIKTGLPNNTQPDNEARYHLVVINLGVMFVLMLLMGILLSLQS